MPDDDRRLGCPLAGTYDLESTLSVLSLGRGDPCFRVDGPGRVRMTLPGPDGVLALALSHEGDEVGVRVSGPGTGWIESHLPSLLGVDFRPPVLDAPPRLRAVAKQRAGFRLPRTPTLFPRVLQIVLQQLVSFQDACNGWRELVRCHGKPVAGHDDLWEPPAATKLAAMVPDEFVECGVLPRHGRRIIGLAREARRIEAAWNGGTAPDAAEQACAVLGRCRGVGPWTLGFLRGAGMGDSDAVVPGDYGFPRRVAYFLTGEDTPATDDDMLRFLEPYRPHRFYVLWLLVTSGHAPPRRGPRRRLLRDTLRRQRSD